MKGLHGAILQGASAKVHRLLEHELTLIGKLKYEPYFLTVRDIVAFARVADISVSGARIGGQFGGVLLSWCHFGQPRDRHDGV